MTSIMTSTEYLMQEATRREPILGPWLASSELIMIYAPKGVGKSLFALSMAYSLANGVSFLGWDCPKPRRVCYVEAEMSIGSMLPRMEAAEESMLTATDPRNLTIVSRDFATNRLANPATIEGQAELMPIFLKHDVIILDNLTSAAIPIDGRDDDLRIWNRMKPFNFGIRNAGKTFIIVHHAGKSGDQLGTSLRENDMDTILRICKPVKPLRPERACIQIEFEKLRNVPHGIVADLYAEYYVQDNRAQWYYSPLKTVLHQQVREMSEKIKNKMTLSIIFRRPLWEIHQILTTPEPQIVTTDRRYPDEEIELF